MRLALHIFQKDARRLWWEVTVTLGLLAALTRMDSQRADFIPGVWEGLLNLFLPAVWAYLIALAIHEEALAGDRQFWVTRPYPWPALLAAKAFFALVFIHLPYLLAAATVLAARGFQPLAHAPLLLWKQVVLVCALTLPAAALAALTRNLAQFFLAGVVVAGAVIVAAGALAPFPWAPVDEERRGVALLALSAAAVVIIMLQYARRRTAVSRTVGIAAILVAAALYAYTPRELTFAVRCWLSPVQAASRQLSLSLAPGEEPPPEERMPRFSAQRARVALPLALSGIPDAARVRLEPLRLEIVVPGGDRWKTSERPQDGPARTRMLQASIWSKDQHAAWLIVELDRSLYERIKAEPLTVTGAAAATFYREGATARLPVEAEPSRIPDLGWCRSDLLYDTQGPMLKVVCESPSRTPLLVQVSLAHPSGGRQWNQRLGDSTLLVGYPTLTWLSPVQRRQTVLHIRDQVPAAEGSGWLVPRAVLSDAHIVLAARQVTCCMIVRHEMRNLRLAQFVVPAKSQ